MMGRGGRVNGRALPRRASNQNGNKSCPFKFTVKWDTMGYYITLSRNGGDAIHSGHPKFDHSVIPFTLCLMTEVEKSDLKNVHDTCAGEGVSSAYLFAKTGKLAPRSKIAYLMSLPNKEEEESFDGTSEFSKFKGDIDKMLRYFESDDQTSYSVLWDVPQEVSAQNKSETDKDASPQHATRLVTQTKVSEGGIPMNNMTDLTNDVAFASIAELVRNNQESRSISNKQNVFVAVAWTIKGMWKQMLSLDSH